MILIQYYLGASGDYTLEEFSEKMAQALWLEKRQIDSMAQSIVKALNGE